MKKISFGSFPLIDMNHSDRKCIDKYSIKNYADLITLNSQIGHISSDVDQYVTPDIILKYFKNTSSQNNELNGDVKSAAYKKRNTLKRAFNSLKAYHKAIQKDGFYRDFTTYPIYIEHAGNNNNHDYDFILLSNDLQKKEILDGIKYDDKITLVFLFLKDMLYPGVPLNEIGIGQSFDLRRDVAKFIEYSKQSGIDPVTAFVRFIKLAGYSKQNKKSNFKISNIIKNSSLFSNGISDKLWALFGGSRDQTEIKDISFMTSVKQADIAQFFDEKNNLSNANSHIGKNSTTYLERQFNLSKTHEYNKILSLLDSLISFNSLDKNQILTDDQPFDIKIELENDDRKFDASIQFDQVVDQVRNNYFESFMVSLITFMDGELNKLIDNKTIKPVKNGSKTDQLITQLTDQINDAMIKLSNTKDVTERRELQHSINNNQSLLNKMQMEQSFTEIYQAKKDIKDQEKKSDLKYNLQNVQSELTGILMDFEKIIYDDGLFRELIQVTGNRRSPTLEDIKNLKAFKFLDISKMRLNESLMDSLNHHIMYDSDVKGDSDTKSNTLAKNLNDIDKRLIDVLNKNIFQLFSKIGRDFGDAKNHIARQYVDLRVEKNPVIRRTVMRPNTFKTYVLNNDVLTSLYDLLHYADNQKYLSGLIKYPPSKISGDYAKMKYCINRLGLDKNPVFIIGQGLITLSSPDTLSLTGGNIFSQIPMADLSKSCSINYDRDVWDDKGILAQVMADIKYLETSKAFKKIPNMEKSIEDAQKKLKSYKNKNDNRSKKEISKLNNIIKSNEDKIRKINEKQRDLDAAYPELMRNMTSRGPVSDYNDDRLNNPRDSRNNNNQQHDSRYNNQRNDSYNNNNQRHDSHNNNQRNDSRDYNQRNDQYNNQRNDSRDYNQRNDSHNNNQRNDSRPDPYDRYRN